MLEEDIIVQPGDDWLYQAEVRRADGSPRSVRGWRFVFYLTREPAEPEAAYVQRLVLEDTPGCDEGQAVGRLDRAILQTPAEYFWWAYVRTAEGFKTTLGRGRFIIPEARADSPLPTPVTATTVFQITTDELRRSMNMLLTVPERGPAGPSAQGGAGASGGSGSANFTLRESDFDAVAGGCYLVDTEANGASTAVLPASPVLGDRILFADARGSWDLEPLTIDRNGKLIDGFAVNFVAATSGMYFEMVFVDNTTGWRILAAGSKPINLTAPVMTAGVLSSLWSCGTGEWTASPTNFLRQWESSDDNQTFTPIDGATGATFSPGATYDGKYLRCSVTAVNSNGNSTPAASNSDVAYAAANITPPAIVGGNTVGQELSLEGDTWTSEGVLDYGWEKDHGGGAVSLTNNATYTPTSADIGAVIVCKVRLWPSGEPGEGVSSEQVTTDPTNAIEAAPFPTSGLAHFWTMNSEIGDGAVSDAIGSNTMNLGVGMSVVVGKIGNAVLMQGGSGYAAFSPQQTVTLPSTGWTIALLFKPGNLSSYNKMFAADDGYTNLYFMEHGGGVHVSWGLATPYGGSPYLSLGTWYHVALTYDGATAGGTGKLYINGAQYGSSVTGLGLASFDITPAAGAAGGEPFIGTVDAFGIWSRPLTSGEVEQIYNSGAGAEP